MWPKFHKVSLGGMEEGGECVEGPGRCKEGGLESY